MANRNYTRLETLNNTNRKCGTHWISDIDGSNVRLTTVEQYRAEVNQSKLEAQRRFQANSKKIKAR